MKSSYLLRPFWDFKFQDEPVQPKYDVNAPDLYIPSTAYVTYVLFVGYILGLRNAFSSDSLATRAELALVASESGLKVFQRPKIRLP